MLKYKKNEENVTKSFRPCISYLVPNCWNKS